MVIVNENLHNSIIDAYIKMIHEEKIQPKEKFLHLRKFVEKLGQKKDDLVYGLSAALIVEAAVRLIVYLTTSPHSERGTSDLPNWIARILQDGPIDASKIGVKMKTGEPDALLLLNALEQLEIVSVIDESSRTFRKMSRNTIPIVVGACFFRKGRKAVASTVFHKELNKIMEFSDENNWMAESKLMDRLHESFLDKD